MHTKALLCAVAGTFALGGCEVLTGGLPSPTPTAGLDTPTPRPTDGTPTDLTPTPTPSGSTPTPTSVPGTPTPTCAPEPGPDPDSHGACSQTYRVFPSGEPGGDFATIQAAIDDARDGACVLVEPGIYSERLNFLGKDVQVIGQSGGDLGVYIEPPITGSGSTVTFSNGETRAARLIGVTLSGSGGSTAEEGCGQADEPTTRVGGAVCIQGSSPTLVDVEIVNSNATHGGGLFIGGGAPLIMAARFEGNRATNYGGAIALMGIGGDGIDPAELVDVSIEGCEAGSGGGIASLGMNGHLEDVDIYRSRALPTSGGFFGQGGGIFQEGGDLMAVRLRIQDNESYQGGGIGVRDPNSSAGGSLTITNALITDNRSMGHGGGLYWAPLGTTSITLNQVTVAGNATLSSGAGIYARDPGTVEAPLNIARSIIAWNQAGSYPLIDFGGGVGAPVDLSLNDTWLYNPETPGADPDPSAFAYAAALSGSGANNTTETPPGFRRPPGAGSLGDPDYHLKTSASARDSGSASPAQLDPDGSPNDPGAFGGPEAWSDDIDDDGMPDDWEHAVGLCVGRDDRQGDLDGDTLSNAAEFEGGTRPDQGDSDLDGSSDGDETGSDTAARDWYRTPGDQGPRTATVGAEASGADFTSLQEAIDLGGPVIQITMAAGEFDTQGRAFFRQGISLTGAGRDTTTITSPARRPFEAYGGFPLLWAGHIATTTLRDLSLGGNRAFRGAGVNLSLADTVDMERLTFEGNDAEVGGGGANVQLTGPLVMVDVTFESNSGQGEGGGLAISGAGSYSDVVRLTGVEWIENTSSSGRGGALSAVGLGDLQITGSTLLRNVSSGEGGGAISLNVSAAALSNTLILDNQATRLGGGIVLDNSELSLENVLLAGNDATTGGAITSAGTTTSSIYAAHALFVANTASDSGGGLWLGQGSTATFYATALKDNEAAVGGDSIHLDDTGGGSLDPTARLLLTGGSLVYAGSDAAHHGLQTEVAEALSESLTIEAVEFADETTFHLRADSPGVDVAGDLDADGSAGDVGIYGGPAGATWDLDGDGIPSYFWPGSYQEAPEGFGGGTFEDEASAWPVRL